jgi:hypothetical protein
MEKIERPEYQISNYGNSCPFTIEVLLDKEVGTYSVKLFIQGEMFTRIVGNERLQAIIIAKDMARSLEDAFRLTFIDKS